MGRKPCCEKVGIKRGRWTAEEDESLSKYIQAHGEGSWRSLPKNAGLLRCGKSCRLRWINYLRGDLKRGNITPQEEHLILQLHSSLGNKWSLIASHLPGRTDNEIKNYWNSYLNKKECSFSLPFPTNQSESTSTINTVKLPHKRKLGRVSRSVAKKYNKNNNTRHLFDKMPMRNPPLHADTKNSALKQPAAVVNENPPIGVVPLEQSGGSSSAVTGTDLGPFEELCDQIIGLNYTNEAGGSGDSTGIWNLNEEVRENGRVVGLENTNVIMNNDEKESDGMGISFACFSPMINTTTWFDIEFDYQDPAMCDEGEYAFLWPWESDNLETGKWS